MLLAARACVSQAVSWIEGLHLWDVLKASQLTSASASECLKQCLLQVQLMEATPKLHGTASSEYLLDVGCCRVLRSMSHSTASTQLVQYSYFDCDVVVLAVSKTDLPEAAESSTYLIIGKDLLVVAGCMASETESRAFSSLQDHPEYDVRDRSIPVGTAAFLRGPVPVCSIFPPFTVGLSTGSCKDTACAEWK